MHVFFLVLQHSAPIALLTQFFLQSTLELDDEVMEGIQCHHEYHHACMMEWLKQHDDCPVCRKQMWTPEAFNEAKNQVFLKHPGTSEMDLAAATEESSSTAETGVPTHDAAVEGEYASDEPVDEEVGSTQTQALEEASLTAETCVPTHDAAVEGEYASGEPVDEEVGGAQTQALATEEPSTERAISAV